MKLLLARCALAITLLAAAGTLDLALAADTVTYTCVLSAEQEVPTNTSLGFGGGTFVIDTDANTMTYHIVYADLAGNETGAHIHGMSDPGANSGVVHGLPLGSVKTGVWNFAEAQEADILAGKTYVNVHTTVVGSGEIRGQIVSMNARLDGGQEVPANASTASGWGTFVVDTVANTLSYHIAYFGLAGESGAHIHGSAGHGGNAGVVHALPLGTPKIGTWSYVEAQEADLLAGKMYVNVHTAAVPSGEIRGQIVPVVAPIDATQEVPANASTGTGIALISIDESLNQLGYDIRYGGLAGAETAAHIHGFAAPGVNAGVQFNLGVGVRKLGVWTYPAGNQPEILNGLTYVNIHSSVVGSGEIRGQIQGFGQLECDEAVDVPEIAAAPRLRLGAASPNPFRANTTIDFSLTRETDVKLQVLDVTGRVVRTLVSESLGAGDHEAAWDGRNDLGAASASGVYFYRLETQDESETRPVVHLR